jgi:16S rRNA (cytosine967-C5)-methyltransferase
MPSKPVRFPPQFKKLPHTSHGMSFSIFYGLTMGLYAKADEALAHQWEQHPTRFTPQQRGQMTMWVNETCRWYPSLALRVKQLTGKRLKDIRAPLRQLLLIGLCSLLHPEERAHQREHHHGNTWVEIGKTVGLSASQLGLLNACLRQAPHLPGLGDPDEALQKTFSAQAHRAFLWGWPLWAVEELEALFPHAPETAYQWVQAMAHHRPLSLFHHKGTKLREKSRLPEAMAYLAPHSETWPQAYQCSRIPEGGIQALPGFTEGEWVVQDAGSAWVAQHAVQQARIVQAVTIVDLCAAPGSKTWWLADAMTQQQPLGHVHAVELQADRLKRLEENLKRLHLSENVTLHQADARYFHLPHCQEADMVLVDAPCSGLGTLSHHPDLWLNRTPAQLETYPPLQRDILKQAARLCRVEGRLVYSTCTWRKAENQGVIQAFLSNHPHWHCVEEQTLAPSVHNDGFYLAVLERLS